MKIPALYLVLADRLVRILYGLGTVFLLVNIATPETFGIYSLQLAVFASISVLANFGLEQISTKYFVEESFPVGSIFLTRFLIAIPFGFFNYFGSGIFLDEAESIVAFALSVGILLNFNALIFNYYNSRRELSKQLKNTLSMIIVSGSLKLIALFKADVYIFFFSVVLDSAIPLSLFLFLEKIRAKIASVTTLLKERRHELFILFLSALVVQLNVRADLFILYSVSSDSIELSQYSLALKLAEVFAVAASIVLTSITPNLFASRDILKTSILFRGYIVKLSGLYIISLLALYFVAPFVVNGLADEAYQVSALLAMWLVSAHFFGAIAAFLSIWYINIGTPSVKLFRSLGLLGLTVIATFFLAGQYGSSGAAVAVLLSNFVVGVLMVFLRKDTVKIVFSFK